MPENKEGGRPWKPYPYGSHLNHTHISLKGSKEQGGRIGSSGRYLVGKRQNGSPLRVLISLYGRIDNMYFLAYLARHIKLESDGSPFPVRYGR
ncbi:hypothetical protein [Sporosarcina sp. P7]|uniref:hypothetical protein n=1 Tax=Sporosarcina sp. P7 TaxID=2048244 RepID=UPI000C171EE9|nr:hypothetical protein [Sporosarcina sp. P7]PID24929.1 hypothetical protein CSV60_06620 [Sporosarcina sp. P7]